MADPFIDTDVIIRLLTQDDPQKQARAAGLFKRIEAGEMQAAAPVTAIADAVYVLASPRLYNVPRADVAALLSTLARLRHFKVSQRATVLRALDLYGTSHLDFGDAMLVAAMEQAGSNVVYAYDEDYDRVKGITRKQP